MKTKLLTRQSDGEETSTSESTTLTKDTTFSVLKNRRRREVLKYLRDHDSEAKLSDLAEHIAAKENDIEIRALSSDQRKRVYIGLYQCHLPKMDDAGVVDFDKNRGDVTLLDQAEELFQYLDNGDEATDADAHRGRYSLALAWGVGLFVVGGLAGVPPMAAIAPQWLALLSTLTLVVLGSAEAVDRYTPD
jgi:DNA-binding transcriptional ArsR family regulator